MAKHWATTPESYLEPKIGDKGAASYPACTILDMFKSCVEKHGDRPAMHHKKDAAGEWKVWSWREYHADCQKFAKSLLHLGVSPFKIINIIGFNAPQWMIANIGAIMAGCIAAGIYTTNSADACEYISNHSEAEVVVVEDNKQLNKYVTMHKNLKKLKAIVVWSEAVNEALSSQMTGIKVCSFDEFLALGSDIGADQLAQCTAQTKPGHCSTLIYTSGTTGPPKAVMLSHDNITWTVKCLIDNFMNMNHSDRVVSYLPLSHVAAQAVDMYCPMYLGCATYFAQPDALKGSLTTTLKEVKPTLFFGVPRVWEKIAEKMQQLGKSVTGAKKMISTWAKGRGAEKNEMAQFGNGGGTPFGFGCANSLVLSKIKEALGLEECKFCCTGAAPISFDTLKYFASLDIPIFELFGQSECSGPHTVGAPGEWKIGTCGRPMPGTETIIAADTKELCYRGRHIFMGYMHMPDKTEETIDSEGYLHSGDVAEFDKDNRLDVPAPSGFMKITGRIKELIITAGGENIPPVLIEEQMKSAMSAVSNCVVIGDRRKFLSMLLTLKTDINMNTGVPLDTLTGDALAVSKEIGSAATTVAEAKACEKWTEYFNKGMKEGNSKTTSAAQMVQKWALLPQDLCEANNELTPTLKLKRPVVSERHSVVIEEIYA